MKQKIIFTLFIGIIIGYFIRFRCDYTTPIRDSSITNPASWN